MGIFVFSKNFQKSRFFDLLAGYSLRASWDVQFVQAPWQLNFECCLWLKTLRVGTRFKDAEAVNAVDRRELLIKLRICVLKMVFAFFDKVAGGCSLRFRPRRNGLGGGLGAGWPVMTAFLLLDGIAFIAHSAGFGRLKNKNWNLPLSSMYGLICCQAMASDVDCKKH